MVVGGVRCTDYLQTHCDLAALVDDRRWEQALECGLYRRLRPFTWHEVRRVPKATARCVEALAAQAR